MPDTPKDKTKNKVSLLPGALELNKMKDSLRRLQDDLPIILEHIKISAEMTRAKYLALKEQGFTDKEALELSKTIS